MKINLTESQRKKIQVIELEMLLKFDELCNENNISYTLAGGTMIGAVRHKGFIPWDDDVDVYVLRDDFNKIRKIFPKALTDTKIFYQNHYTDKNYYYQFDKLRMNGTVFEETFLKKHDINHGVFIDIFPIDYIPNSSILRLNQYIEYRFMRLILMCKYININARKGRKKYLAFIIRSLFFWVSLDKLYERSEQIAQKYLKNRKDCKFVRNLNSVGSDGTKETYGLEDFKKIKKIEFESNLLSISVNYDQMLRKIYGNYMKLPPKSERKTRHDLEKLKL
ncbi:LicD family protein [Limosilactobacillus pontis]|uniref:LicD family protein n=1 Tax=Limosilactobacillus pontis TaxID=35787 RepID=A0ABT7V090_9LACO|nr:LicD family protein [Limosilactobacillus pontis]MDM8267375.1 LicD family protein [Limosilactobacillus pontis]